MLSAKACTSCERTWRFQAAASADDLNDFAVYLVTVYNFAAIGNLFTGGFRM